MNTLPRLDNVVLTRIADIDAAKAARLASAVGVPACAPDELHAASDVDIVLNLTIPLAHADVALAAIAAGKHVYGEKPLAADTVTARSVLDAAEAAGVVVGCAPDTVLGTGVQTARASLDAGDIGSGPRAGDEIPVRVATHVTGVLEHVGGELSTLVMSVDIWGAQLPRIEVYGTEGSLSVPDPNGFDGTVRIFRDDWVDLPVRAGHPDAVRGVGVADMARSIVEATPDRADGVLAFHVLDVMECLLRTAESGTSVTIGSTCERPAAVTA